MTHRLSLSRQMKVGLFLLVGVVVLLSSLFLVGGGRLFKSYAILHAHFDNVQGLSEGSLISLSGVSVGNVDKFVFIPTENKLDVWLKIDADYLPRLTENSSVDIRTQGALGDKFIYIIPGSPGGQPLKNGDNIEVAKATDLLAVLSEKANDLTKVFDILVEVDKFVKVLNTDNRAERIMKNLVESSQDFKAAAKDSRDMIAEMKGQDAKKISSMVAKMERILTKVDRGEGTLGALINDASIHDSLKAMLGAPDRKKSMKTLIRSSIEKGDKEKE
jgi:phospholipid/cholesterol/gamma-HCH transport system substrate-binding protein